MDLEKDIPYPVKTIDGRPVEVPVRQLDADTIAADGKRYRITNFNAPETAKERAGIFTPDQIMGDTSEEDAAEIARLGGFTNIKTSGKQDVYKRQLAEQTTPSGTSDLGSTLVGLGLQRMGINTAPEVVQDRLTTSAATRLFKGAASKDPMLNLAMQRRQEAEEEAAKLGTTVFTAKQTASNEQELAAFKNLIGPKAQASMVEEISRLQGLIKDPTIRPDLKEKFKTKLDEEKRNLFISSILPDYIEGTDVRNPDRNRYNQAKYQLATSLHNSSLDAIKYLSGIGEMVGDKAKWDYLKDISRAKTRELKAEQASLPDVLSSYKDINTQDPWSAIQDTGLYVGNLVAGTVPQMAVLATAGMVAGATGLGLVGAGLVDITIGSPMYIGQYYADQPEDKKNASLAIGLGLTSYILDKVGFSILGGKAAGFNLLGVSGANKAAKALVDAGKFTSTAEAKDFLASATKKELVNLAELGGNFAKQQYATTEAALRGLMVVEGKGLSEALTEGAQQYAQQIATTGVWSTDVQYEKDFWRGIVDAMIGGKVMGVSLGTAGKALDTMGWHAAANSKEEFKGMLSEAQLSQQQPEMYMPIQLADGTITTRLMEIDDLTKELDGATDNTRTVQDLPETKGTWNTLKSIITKPSQLVGQLGHQIAPSVFKEDGTFKPNLAKLKALIGGYGLLPGDHYSRAIQKTIGRLNSMVETSDEIATSLGTSKVQAEKMIRDAWESHWKHDKHTGNPALDKVIFGADKLRRELFALTNDPKYYDRLAGLSLLFEGAQINPADVVNQQQRLIDYLENKGMSRREARKIINDLVSKNSEAVSNARSVISQYGMITDPTLSDIFKPDFFVSLENIKHHTATRYANNKYFGKGGTKLVQLLDAAKENGEFETEEDYLHAATQVKAMYNIVNGQYKNINSEFLKTALSWGTTMAMLGSLGKAALSSFPESVAALLGTPGDKVLQQLKHNSVTYFREIKNDFNKGMSLTLSSRGLSYARHSPLFEGRVELQHLNEEMEKLNKNQKASIEDYNKLQAKIDKLTYDVTGRTLLEVLGYSDSGYSTQNKYEYVDTRHRDAMNAMAHIITLRALTDSTRIAALSMASDVVFSKLAALRNIPFDQRESKFASGYGLSVQEAQDLRDLVDAGVNVNTALFTMDNMIQLGVNPTVLGYEMNPLMDQSGNIRPDYKAFMDNIYTGISNMVDNKVGNPQPHTLPRFYHDPRMRLITAMSRFVANSTSTLLPNLYKRYIMEGSVGMRYQAFAIIAGMIMLSLVANELKDELSYKDGYNPYIKGTGKNVQRAIYGSGVLGQYERIVDAAMPLYPHEKASPLEDPLRWAVASAKDASPAINWYSKPIGAAFDLSEGNTANAVKKLVRATPVLGSFPVVADVASSQFK